MIQQPIGRLESVDVRTVWESESADFTPWLAQEESLKLLGDAVGLDLELEAQEQTVGPFRADILCRDAQTDSWVLIENQLERTDHSHLGQLLTYAAGLQAVSVVWIAYAFAEEHRATLDWLNEITDDRFNFFGIVVEVLRIGDSPVAPRFNVVSKPNNWTKSVSGAASRIRAEGLSEAEQLRLDYWTAFDQVIRSRPGAPRPRAPRPLYYTSCGVGRSGFHLIAIASTQEKWLGAGLALIGSEAKSNYRALARDRQAIDAEIGPGLEWREMTDNIESRIMFVRESVDISTREGWDEQHAWIADCLERTYRVFAPRVKALSLGEGADE